MPELQQGSNFLLDTQGGDNNSLLLVHDLEQHAPATLFSLFELEMSDLEQDLFDNCGSIFLFAWPSEEDCYFRPTDLPFFPSGDDEQG